MIYDIFMPGYIIRYAHCGEDREEACLPGVVGPRYTERDRNDDT
jgi:hypothetical protein